MSIHGWNPREPGFGGPSHECSFLLSLDVFCFLKKKKKPDMETEAHGPGILISLLLTAVGWDKGEYVSKELNLPCGAKMQISLVLSLVFGCLTPLKEENMSSGGYFMRNQYE